LTAICIRSETGLMKRAHTSFALKCQTQELSGALKAVTFKHDSLLRKFASLRTRGLVATAGGNPGKCSDYS
jgi:hypothetical protein